MNNLRQWRLRRSLTLDGLATATGLTKSYLSKVERSVSSPSQQTMLKIADAVDAMPDEIFDGIEERDEVKIVRARRGMVMTPRGFDAVTAAGSGRSMNAYIVRPPRTVPRGRLMSRRAGEEFIYVTSGVIELKIGSRRETLREGDSAQFDATTPHRIVAVSEEEAEALIVITDYAR